MKTRLICLCCGRVVSPMEFWGYWPTKYSEAEGKSEGPMHGPFCEKCYNMHKKRHSIHPVINF